MRDEGTRNNLCTTLDGQQLEVILKFTYLGVTIWQDNSYSEEILRRIGTATTSLKKFAPFYTFSRAK